MKIKNRILSVLLLLVVIAGFGFVMKERIQPGSDGTFVPAIMTMVGGKSGSNAYAAPAQSAVSQPAAAEQPKTTAAPVVLPDISAFTTVAENDTRTCDMIYPAPTGYDKVDNAVKSVYEKERRDFLKRTSPSSGENLFMAGECFSSGDYYSLVTLAECNGIITVNTSVISRAGKVVEPSEILGSRYKEYFADYLETNILRFRSLADNLSDDYASHISNSSDNYNRVLLRADGTADVYFAPGELVNSDSDIAVNIPANVISGEYFGRRRIDPNRKMVALTFDDGPDDVNTPRIQDCLEKYGVVATFFDVGVHVDEFPEVTARSAALGCEIGSHTYNHINLPSAGRALLESDKAKADAAFTNAIGYIPYLMRPPEGAIGGQAKFFFDSPYIGWSCDTLDWMSRNTSSIVNTVKGFGNLDGQIILMHGIYDTSAAAAEIIIPWLLDQGYQLVTVTELIENHYNMMLEPHIYYAVDFLLYGRTPV